MAQYKKTDNDNLETKLDLRRHFLSRYHQEPGSVFDCCQGNRVMWGRLQPEFPHLKYWGVDIKHKPGRLKVDSQRLLEMGLQADVIDVDTYGSPWSHWMALLPHVQRPCTVFLTWGMAQRGGATSVGKFMSTQIVFPSLIVPESFHQHIIDHYLSIALWQPNRFGLQIVEAAEAEKEGRSARYFGLHLKPK